MRDGSLFPADQWVWRKCSGRMYETLPVGERGRGGDRGRRPVDSGGDRGRRKKILFFSSSDDVAAKLASVPVSLRRVLHVYAHWTSILPCQHLGVDLTNFLKG